MAAPPRGAGKKHMSSSHSSHSDWEQCGSGTNRRSTTCRAHDPRLCCHETKNRRNGDRNWCGCRSRPRNAGEGGGERRRGEQQRRRRARDGSGRRCGRRRGRSAHRTRAMRCRTRERGQAQRTKEQHDDDSSSSTITAPQATRMGRNDKKPAPELAQAQTLTRGEDRVALPLRSPPAAVTKRQR